MQIRRGDTVLVIAGKEKGKTGRVERQLTKESRIIIEGVNLVTRHMKARPGVRQAGRVQQEASIHISNVVLLCNKCSRPTKPTRLSLESGAKVRVCSRCKEVIDDTGQ